jgi:hypothetical protein
MKLWKLIKKDKTEEKQLAQLRRFLRPEENPCDFKIEPVVEIEKYDIIVLYHKMGLSEIARYRLEKSFVESLRTIGIDNKVIVLEEDMRIGVVRKTTTTEKC